MSRSTGFSPFFSGISAQDVENVQLIMAWYPEIRVEITQSGLAITDTVFSFLLWLKKAGVFPCEPGEKNESALLLVKAYLAHDSNLTFERGVLLQETVHAFNAFDEHGQFTIELVRQLAAIDSHDQYLGACVLIHQFSAQGLLPASTTNTEFNYIIKHAKLLYPIFIGFEKSAFISCYQYWAQLIAIAECDSQALETLASCLHDLEKMNEYDASWMTPFFDRLLQIGDVINCVTEIDRLSMSISSYAMFCESEDVRELLLQYPGEVELLCLLGFSLSDVVSRVEVVGVDEGRLALQCMNTETSVMLLGLMNYGLSPALIKDFFLNASVLGTLDRIHDATRQIGLQDQTNILQLLVQRVNAHFSGAAGDSSVALDFCLQQFWHEILDFECFGFDDELRRLLSNHRLSLAQLFKVGFTLESVVSLHYCSLRVSSDMARQAGVAGVIPIQSVLPKILSQITSEAVPILRAIQKNNSRVLFLYVLLNALDEVGKIGKQYKAVGAYNIKPKGLYQLFDLLDRFSHQCALTPCSVKGFFEAYCKIFLDTYAFVGLSDDVKAQVVKRPDRLRYLNLNGVSAPRFITLPEAMQLKIASIDEAYFDAVMKMCVGYEVVAATALALDNLGLLFECLLRESVRSDLMVLSAKGDDQLIYDFWRSVDYNNLASVDIESELKAFVHPSTPMKSASQKNTIKPMSPTLDRFGVSFWRPGTLSASQKKSMARRQEKNHEMQQRASL